MTGKSVKYHEILTYQGHITFYLHLGMRTYNPSYPYTLYCSQECC